MDTEKFKAEIIAEIERRISGFVADPTHLHGYIKDTRNIVSEYNGRQIFEMLQNIDDQMTDAELSEENRVGQIELNKKTGCLYFRNRGRPFSISGIKSIMYPHVSSHDKEGKNSRTIGNKGLGFRSLLNWHPKSIVIRSAGLAFTFSSTIVKQQIVAHKELSTITGVKDLPTLTFPAIEDWAGGDGQWDTEIELGGVDFESKIGNPAKCISDELAEFNPELMLFLPNLRRIVIKIVDGGKEVCTEYIATAWQVVKGCVPATKDASVDERTISKTIGGVKEFETRWIAYRGDGEFKDIHLDEDESPGYNYAIAIPYEPEERHLFENLYNYLPLRHVLVKLPCLVHATVKLDGRRDVLVPHEANDNLFDKILPSAFKDFAENLRKSNEVHDPWLPYRLLLPPTQDYREYLGMLYQHLDNIRSEGAFCPCVDGQYRNDEQCVYFMALADGCDITGFFNAHREFIPNYVLNCPPIGFQERRISEEKLREYVNAALTQTKKRKCVYADEVLSDLAFVLWSIGERSSWGKSGPYWLLHREDDVVLGEGRDNVYTPVSVDTTPLKFPDYMNADFVASGLWGTLLKRFTVIRNRWIGYDKKKTENEIRDYLIPELQRILRIEWYDRDSAAKKIISSAIEYLRIEDISLQEKKSIVSQLIDALYANFRDDSEPHPRSERVPIMVCENGTIKYADDFLFDSARAFYGEALSADIFLTEQHMMELVQDADVVHLKAFMRYLGVRDDIRIKRLTINTRSGRSNEYLKFLQSKGEAQGGLPSASIYHEALKVPLTVVALRDANILMSDTITAAAFLRLLEINSQQESFLKLLSEDIEFEWKEEGGKKFYPKRVNWSYIAYQLYGKFEKVIYGENDKVLSDLGWRFEESRNGISADVLKKLGAKSKFSDLTADELYGLLQSVAEKKITPTQDFYKKVNAALGVLEENKERVVPPPDLKVYAKWQTPEGEETGFCPVCEVYYHDNPAHARVLVKDHKIMFLGSRVGVDNVCRRFGVQKLNEKAAVISSFHPAPPDLQAAFNADLGKKLPLLSIILCQHWAKGIDACRKAIAAVHVKLGSEIDYSYAGGKNCKLDQFEYIRDKAEASGAFYLNIGDCHDLSDLSSRDIRKLARSLAGILCDAVNLTDEDLQKQFYACISDYETTEEDLRERGCLDSIDMDVKIVPNYYQSHRSVLHSLADAIWAQFIKPAVWTYLNENRNLQKFYRAYLEEGYKPMIEKALSPGGTLEVLCADKQLEIVAETQWRNEILDFLKKTNWIPSICNGNGPTIDWTAVERDTQPQWKEMESDELYPDIDADDVSAEVLSLMSFKGNREKIVELLKASADTGKIEGRLKETELKLLKVCDSAVEFSRPVDGANGGGKHGTGSGQAMTKKRAENMKSLGDWAERLVEHWLKSAPENKGISVVERVSGASRSAHRDDSLHCDISYVKEGKMYYLEVKACDNGVFHMSNGELEYARRNPDVYRLALVYVETMQVKIVADVYNKLKDVKVPENWKIAVN